MLNLKDSNDFIIQLIERNTPFLIARPGIPMHFVYNYIISGRVGVDIAHLMQIIPTGIYGNTLDEFKIWFEKYTKPIRECDAIGTWKGTMFVEQNFFINQYNLTPIYSRVFEPFYCILEGIKPWTHSLLGKKVLIVNPFVDSMKKQLTNKFQIFKHEKVFLDEQDFVFYKSYMTQAGNHLHSSWVETFKLMCEDIKKLDFDIALLGCGCYGHPLCDFIRNELNKSAIYVGGGLQLLFGVMGKRWLERQDWQKIIKDNDCKFIRPSKEEQCPNYKNAGVVDGGCYW